VELAAGEARRGDEKEKLSTKRSERLQDDCGREQNETRECSKERKKGNECEKGENSQKKSSEIAGQELKLGDFNNLVVTQPQSSRGRLRDGGEDEAWHGLDGLV